MNYYLIGFLVLVVLGVLIFFVPDDEADIDIDDLHDSELARVGTDSMTSEERMAPHDNVRPMTGGEYTRHGSGVQHD